MFNSQKDITMNNMLLCCTCILMVIVFGSESDQSQSAKKRRVEALNIPTIHSFNAQRGNDEFQNGQLAKNVLNPDANNGWNGGDYVCPTPQTGTRISNYNCSNWIKFQFQEKVKVHKFAYRTKGDYTHDPKDMLLFADDQQVLNFRGNASMTDWQIFDVSSTISAQIWKWEILTRYTEWQAYVQAVQFQIEIDDTLIPNDFSASLAKDVKCKGNCR